MKRKILLSAVSVLFALALVTPVTRASAAPNTPQTYCYNGALNSSYPACNVCPTGKVYDSGTRSCVNPPPPPPPPPPPTPPAPPSSSSSSTSNSSAAAQAAAQAAANAAAAANVGVNVGPNTATTGASTSNAQGGAGGQGGQGGVGQGGAAAIGNVTTGPSTATSGPSTSGVNAHIDASDRSVSNVTDNSVSKTYAFASSAVQTPQAPIANPSSMLVTGVECGPRVILKKEEVRGNTTYVFGLFPGKTEYTTTQYPVPDEAMPWRTVPLPNGDVKYYGHRVNAVVSVINFGNSSQLGLGGSSAGGASLSGSLGGNNGAQYQVVTYVVTDCDAGTRREIVVVPEKKVEQPAAAVVSQWQPAQTYTSPGPAVCVIPQKVNKASKRKTLAQICVEQAKRKKK